MLILTGTSKSSFREGGSVGVLCFYGNGTETPCPLVLLASRKALSGSVVQAQAGVVSLPSSSESWGGLVLCYYRWQIVCAVGRRDSSLSSSPGLFQPLIHPLLHVGRGRRLSLLPRVPLISGGGKKRARLEPAGLAELRQ